MADVRSRRPPARRAGVRYDDDDDDDDAEDEHHGDPGDRDDHDRQEREPDGKRESLPKERRSERGHFLAPDALRDRFDAQPNV